jgi:hypothetical protein
MYLARLTDEGDLTTYEVDDSALAYGDSPGHSWAVKREPRTWRYGARNDDNPMLCCGGWASIRHTAAIAIMFVQAAAEQREAA